jgi:hypothetical protein
VLPLAHDGGFLPNVYGLLSGTIRVPPRRVPFGCKTAQVTFVIGLGRCEALGTREPMA